MYTGDRSFGLLEQAIHATWIKQRVTLDNIANVETPGYKAKYVDFQTQLEELCDSPNHHYSEAQLERMKPSVNAVIREDTTTSMRADGNNVDIIKENVELARAQLEYQYMQSKISYRLSSLRHVISEGKR